MATSLRWIRIYQFNQHGKQPQLAGSAKSVEVDGKRIVLVYTGEQYYALEDHCPHAGAKFSAGGWCENGELICPVHRHRFNLINGRGTRGDYVPTYPVEVREDGVWVGFRKRWYQLWK